MGMHTCTDRYTYTNGNMHTSTPPPYTWKEKTNDLELSTGEVYDRRWDEQIVAHLYMIVEELFVTIAKHQGSFTLQRKTLLIYCPGDSRAWSQQNLAQLWRGPHGRWHPNGGTVLGRKDHHQAGASERPRIHNIFQGHPIRSYCLRVTVLPPFWKGLLQYNARI